MNDIIKDYKDEDFTKFEWLVYGVLFPVVFILICVLVA